MCLTATRLLAVFLRSISKQRAQPMQLLRPGFGPFGEHERTCGPPKSRHSGCNESARKLLPERFAWFLSDRNLAKNCAGLARRRPPTERWQDKRARGARRSGGWGTQTHQALHTRCEITRQPADSSNPLSQRQFTHLVADVTRLPRSSYGFRCDRRAGRGVAPRAHRPFFWPKSRATVRA